MSQTQENLRAVVERHATGASKYGYFLLAAAASCIAFAVQKSDNLTIGWPALPLALAVGSWVMSFYCGCKNITLTQQGMYANGEMLMLYIGNHAKQPADPATTGAAIEIVRTRANEYVDRAASYAGWQFRLLAAGGLLFIAWHVLTIYLRNHPIPVWMATP